MILAVIAPIVGIPAPPSLVAFLLIGSIVSVGGHFPFLPQPLPGPLRFLLTAVALILRTRVQIQGTPAMGTSLFFHGLPPHSP